MHFATLKVALQDWTDIDVAQYHLALCIGLMSPDVALSGKVKHVFWSTHNIGNMLYHMLEELSQQAILEKRDEPDYQYRWNSAFVGAWH